MVAVEISKKSFVALKHLILVLFGAVVVFFLLIFSREGARGEGQTFSALGAGVAHADAPSCTGGYMCASGGGGSGGGSGCNSAGSSSGESGCSCGCDCSGCTGS